MELGSHMYSSLRFGISEKNLVNQVLRIDPAARQRS